jgi:hypothetical protein
MPERRGERVVETTTEARAGVTGHNVRCVLAFTSSVLSRPSSSSIFCFLAERAAYPAETVDCNK